MNTRPILHALAAYEEAYWRTTLSGYKSDSPSYVFASSAASLWYSLKGTLEKASVPLDEVGMRAYLGDLRVSCHAYFESKMETPFTPPLPLLLPPPPRFVPVPTLAADASSNPPQALV